MVATESPGSSALDGLRRADENMGIAAFQTRRALDAAKRYQVFGKAHEQLFTEIRVGDFASAELHDRLDAIALLQKPNGVVFLEVVIVVVGIGTEFQFLYLHHVLLSLGFVLFFLEL